MDPYQILGVGKEASPEEVKKAFRKKAHSSHPDKGGKPETFHQVVAANEILADPERRAAFDEFGAVFNAQEYAQVVRQEAVELLNQMIDNNSIDQLKIVDLKLEAVAQVKKLRKDLDHQMKELSKKIAKKKEIAGRFKPKQGQVNALMETFLHQLKEDERRGQLMKLNRKKMMDVITFFEEYEYEQDVVQSGTFYFTSTT